MNNQEKRLIAQIRRGEAAALEEAVTRYSRLVWTVVAGVLGPSLPREEAEECVADVFIELWRRADRFDAARGTLKAYLCVLARSRALDRLRSAARFPAEALDEDLCAPTDDDPLNRLVTRDTFERACHIIDAMPPETGEPLRLRLIYELPPAAIAVRLSVPVEAVYTAVRRGKELLRARLAGDSEN